jgi:alkyl hydroperoxide reductase subunit AhpF
MRRRVKSDRITRRTLLAGLGAGAATLTPAHAALLPPGRRTEKYDVVVIGTGMAGTAASLQAKLDGGNVVVLAYIAGRNTLAKEWAMPNSTTRLQATRAL